MHKRVQGHPGFLGIELSDRTRVGSLPVGYKQFVEIARSWIKEYCFIVLDEPTAVLTETEAEQFLSLCTCRSAIAFIFISHKLDEVKNSPSRVCPQGRRDGGGLPHG